MKFILILTFATYVNCLRKDDAVGTESRSKRIERIDESHPLKRTGDYTRNKKLGNHENVKYRKEQDYFNAGRYDDNYYDMGGRYQDNRRRSSNDNNPDDSYPDSALQKLERLIQKKPDVLISVKLHNISFCVNDFEAEPRKGNGGKFSKFDSLLNSVFPIQREIRLYYIEIRAKGQSLFETQGQCFYTFQSQDIHEVINSQTNLVTTNNGAFLDVKGQEQFRIEFSLGNRRDVIRTNDGSELIFFDPELRINNNCFIYRMLGFVKPHGLSREKTSMVMNSFSKMMSNPNDVDKFIEAHENLPYVKIFTKEISTGPHDDLPFKIFKPFIKETQKDIVQIDFCRASVAMYQCMIQDQGPIYEFLYSNVQLPRGGFHEVQDVAGPIMRNLFNQALYMLQDQAHRIAQGGDLRKIRLTIMQYLKQSFQEHRKHTRNNEKFHEFQNHFGAFHGSYKQKTVN